MDTLKYLSIINIKICFIYLKKKKKRKHHQI